MVGVVSVAAVVGVVAVVCVVCVVAVVWSSCSSWHFVVDMVGVVRCSCCIIV